MSDEMTPAKVQEMLLTRPFHQWLGLTVTAVDRRRRSSSKPSGARNGWSIRKAVGPTAASWPRSSI